MGGPPSNGCSRRHESPNQPERIRGRSDPFGIVPEKRQHALSLGAPPFEAPAPGDPVGQQLDQPGGTRPQPAPAARIHLHGDGQILGSVQPRASKMPEPQDLYLVHGFLPRTQSDELEHPGPMPTGNHGAQSVSLCPAAKVFLDELPVADRRDEIDVPVPR